MFAEAGRSESFDPLVDLYGIWTTELAERYLPIQGAPPAKYECVDGKLILSPYEAAPNGYAVMKFGYLHMEPARAVGLRLYGTVNMRMSPQRWIQPDLTVVRKPSEGAWVQAEDVVLVGEFISPSSRGRDKIDKPALCAAAGIAYYLTGEVSLTDEFAAVAMWRLTENGYQLIAKASAGERFEVDQPFKMSFDPIELLDL
jgi:Uma2 family endonuclease